MDVRALLLLGVVAGEEVPAAVALDGVIDEGIEVLTEQGLDDRVAGLAQLRLHLLDGLDARRIQVHVDVSRDEAGAEGPQIGLDLLGRRLVGLVVAVRDEVLTAIVAVDLQAVLLTALLLRRLLLVGLHLGVGRDAAVHRHSHPPFLPADDAGSV